MRAQLVGGKLSSVRRLLAPPEAGPPRRGLSSPSEEPTRAMPLSSSWGVPARKKPPPEKSCSAPTSAALPRSSARNGRSRVAANHHKRQPAASGPRASPTPSAIEPIRAEMPCPHIGATDSPRRPLPEPPPGPASHVLRRAALRVVSHRPCDGRPPKRSSASTGSAGFRGSHAPQGASSVCSPREIQGWASTARVGRLHDHRQRPSDRAETAAITGLAFFCASAQHVVGHPCRRAVPRTRCTP